MKIFYRSFSKVILTFIISFLVISGLHEALYGQSRIKYRGKEIFLSGINAAWVSFAADLGPGAPDLNQFRIEFQTVRDSGGNAMRLWLFTNGANAPAYNSNGFVTNPGAVAIQNLKQILSLAHHYNIGLVLCLWSFDMLRRPELDTARLNANLKMLTDTSYTWSFIRNALIPIVDSVKGDSAILAWEVCNEPNGMTTGMNYYPVDPTVSQTDVQRFTNLIAGAIHRTDPNALVTTGPGSFQTLTDVNPIAKISASQLSLSQLRNITGGFNASHRTSLTVQQMKNYIEKISVIPDSNYYRDDRLIRAGGDSSGILDFYTVHYYYYGSTALSPFSHPFQYWNLTKPTAVAEFYMQPTDGMPDYNLYPALYNYGYAGALAWSWTDFPKTPNNPLNAANDTWASLRYMKNYFGQDIDPYQIDYPAVSIISPKDSAWFNDSTSIIITVMVKDTGSSIAYVKFFSSDSLLAEVIVPDSISSGTSFYSFNWKNIQNGIYNLTALTENSLGQQEISSAVRVNFGTVTMTKLEAEKAAISGSGITVKSDPAASGGAFLDAATNDSNATVTWQFVNGSSAGNYPISIGYKLFYQSPKTQYINVNGKRADTVTFSGSTSAWLEQTINVNLIQGTNKVQMQMYWGWMYLDYLAVPTSILTSVEDNKEIPNTFSLSQNYPNPFNPSTVINYQLSAASYVTLKVYDILGREVSTLVNEEKPAGKYKIELNASHLASGIYFYTLRAGSFEMTKKMILLK